jgi:5-methylcytosine-specific restriction enzyme A
MNSEFKERIQEHISQAVGFNFTAVDIYARQKRIIGVSMDSNTVSLRADSPEYPSGYSFRITTYSKRFDVQFIPDNYARRLLDEMAKNTIGHIQFSKLAQAISSTSCILTLKINDQKMPIMDPNAWPKEWRRLEISLQRYSDSFEPENVATMERAILDCAGKFCSMVILLMPIEQVTNYASPDIRGLPEGAKMRIEVNKYERNPINREACIVVNGMLCQVCGFNFEEKYGSLGKNFIHVHHIIPVSKIEANYMIDPISDLIPVCPNCHAMIHRENPPLSVERLREIIAGTLEK